MSEAFGFDKEEALSLLRLLVTTNTVNPPGNEMLLAKKLKPILEKEGFAVTIDEFVPSRCNMIVRYRGKAATPEVVFTGHLDTVPLGDITWHHDPFGCEVEGDKAFGRGISDMKSGVAAALYSMILLKRSGYTPDHDIVFVATAGEEKMSIGAFDFIKKGGMDHAGALIVCEPSSLELSPAHKGACFVKVEFFGKVAHGSMPHLGVNAIYHMASFAEALKNTAFDVKPDPHLGMPTVSLNLVKGGAALNVVPDHAECILDFRTIPGMKWSDIQKYIDSVLAKLAGTDGLKYSYEKIIELPSVACPSEDNILKAFDEAAGHPLPRKYLVFYTDASAMVTKKGLPVVIFGPGETHMAHQPDEYVLLSKYYASIGIYQKFMQLYHF
ncbi:MAG: M20 family metallopeptidase [Succiniclasticum sp.]|jgi:succinyl-diaminopimelate desuccinylase